MNIRRDLKLFLIGFLVAGSMSLAAEPVENLGLSAVVNENNPIESIHIEDLRDYYLKRKRTWPNGLGVRFIDRSSNSSLRRTFLEEVLRRPAEEVDLYWIGQKLYTGDGAPLQGGSDLMVAQFVSSFEGALGYIAQGASLRTKGVKVIPIVKGK